MMRFIKSAVHKVLPKKLELAYNGYRQRNLARRNQLMTTEEVFTKIYSTNRWGGERGVFCSGAGSHETGIVSPYVCKVTAELDRIGASSMTAVDLGCGDYSVGRQLSSACGRYVGVDIVKDLVAHNQALFGRHNVSFRHVNIVEEPLPEGDICFLRQVLQHLSNDQIAAVLPKLEQFTWCFITEHHPSSDRLDQPNIDKPQGDDIRISRGSGVFLEQHPFVVPAERYNLLLEVPGLISGDEADPGVIRTYVLKRGRPLDGESSRSPNRAAV
jgi:hypothetical protein